MNRTISNVAREVLYLCTYRQTLKAAKRTLAVRPLIFNVVIVSFTTGPGSSTLPIRIYSAARLGVKPEINAICTLVIALIAVVIVIASLASKLSSARGESAAPL